MCNFVPNWRIGRDYDSRDNIERKRWNVRIEGISQENAENVMVSEKIKRQRARNHSTGMAIFDMERNRNIPQPEGDAERQSRQRKNVNNCFNFIPPFDPSRQTKFFPPQLTSSLCRPSSLAVRFAAVFVLVFFFFARIDRIELDSIFFSLSASFRRYFMQIWKLSIYEHCSVVHRIVIFAVDRTTQGTRKRERETERERE